MTKEEYISLHKTNDVLFSKKYSKPKYDCPECKNGHMRKNLLIVLTSNPPMFQYECDTCGHIDYLNF